MDSDDYLQEYALEHSASLLMRHDIDVAMYSVFIARDASSYAQVEFDWQVFPPHIEGLYTPIDLINALGGYAMITSAGGFVGKASLIFEHNITFIPHILYEDIAFVTQAIMCCKNLYISREPVYNYLLNPLSISNTPMTREKQIQSTYSYFMTLQTFVQFFKEQENPVMKEYFYRACVDTCKKITKTLQFVGYVKELGFSKKDLLSLLPQFNIKGKTYFCCLFPRIYGFPKRVRLALQRCIFSLSSL